MTSADATARVVGRWATARLRLVNRGWWPQPGGIERQFDNVTALGTVQDAAIAIWTATQEPHVTCGTRVRRSPVGASPMALYVLWLAASLWWDGIRHHRRRAITVVGGSSVETAVVLALPSCLRGRAVVYLAGGDAAGSEFASIRRPWLRRLIIARADGIIVHTPSYGRELQEWGYRGEVHVVPVLTRRAHAACHLWKAPSTPHGAVRALWCGRDHPVKNLSALARLMRGAFTAAGIRLCLIVDRPPDDFAGAEIHVGCHDPRSHLPYMDVLVLTSLHESQPNVLAEAALAGVPLVAYAVGGLPEAVCELGHGVLLSTEATDEEFAATVATVARTYREPERRSALRLRAEEVYHHDAEQAWTKAVWGTARRSLMASPVPVDKERQ